MNTLTPAATTALIDWSP
jgi:hypothetical protein